MTGEEPDPALRDAGADLGSVVAAAGRRWAVIVGISKYKDEGLYLRFADRDANDLYSLLSSPRAAGSYQPGRVRLLINEEATTPELTRAVRGFLMGATSDDLVLLYFACHGGPDPRRPGGPLYLYSHDTDPQDVAGTAFPMDEIERSLRDNVQAHRGVIIVDTCHSAAVAGGRAPHTAEATSNYLKSMTDSAGAIALLTSAEAAEAAEEDERWGGGHGVFTHFLLEGLRGAADGYRSTKDGIVSVGELFEYVRDQVQDATKGRQHPAIGTTAFDRNLPMAITDIEAPRYLRGGYIDYRLLGAPLVLTLEDEAFCVAISPSGRTLAVATNGGVMLWHGKKHAADWTSEGELATTRNAVGYDGYVYDVVFSPNGRLLATGGQDGFVRMHEIESLDVQQRWDRRPHIDAVYSISFSPDGTLLATGGYDRKVCLMDVESGAVRRSFPRSGRISAIAFSPTPTSAGAPHRNAIDRRGPSLAIGSLDNSIYLWDILTGRCTEVGKHVSSIEGLDFSPDANRLASCGLDKAVKLWNLRTQPPTEEWSNNTEHEYLVRAVAFSPDGGTLASASWDKTVRFWETRTGMPYQPSNEEGWPSHEDWIWSVTFSRDGRAFATAGSDKRVIVLRLRR